MLGLLAITFLVGLGIWYLTTLNFEIGSGITEAKKQAKEGEYKVVDPEAPKELRGSVGDKKEVGIDEIK